MTPLAVVLDNRPQTRSGKDSLRSLYILELLEHAGIFFDQLTKSQIQTDLKKYSILLLPYDMELDSDDKRRISDFVRSGNGLIGIGGSSGLDDLFGCETKDSIAEGHIKITGFHPITNDLKSSLHFFGGKSVIAKADSSISLAKSETKDGAWLGEAIIERHFERRFGAGIALLFAPDIVNSIVHIQQGVNISSDGIPAPDGSAPINDGILKAEDGLVLDWEKDRTPIGDEKHKIFLEPISDELRELIIKAIFYCCFKLSVWLPMLWYWPKGMDAVGHISHDSDGNEPSKAWSLLKVMKNLNVKSSWCIIYPGGYPEEFYEALKKDGYEIAFHYDAKTGDALTTWNESNFRYQLSWLNREAKLNPIPSNKNHYTRWEGRLEFFRWCESMGIKNDQTKGPSKIGTIGFPLGGSHPWFPIDDETDGRRFDVLEINMLTQDLVVVCPAYFGNCLLDSALKHHGVAHFLFHPAHIEKPGVAEALEDLVNYGRHKKIEWWTCEDIGKWERRRRKVALKAFSQTKNGDGVVCEIDLEESLQDLTLLFPLLNNNFVIRINGKLMNWNRINRYGFDLAQVILGK